MWCTFKLCLFIIHHCTCTYWHTHACMYTLTHPHTHTHTHTYNRVCEDVHIHYTSHMCMCIRTLVNLCTGQHTHGCMYKPHTRTLRCQTNVTVIGDVIFPPWAKGNPWEFIRVQREVLNSFFFVAMPQYCSPHGTLGCIMWYTHIMYIYAMLVDHTSLHMHR